jgi:galactokinase
VHTLISKLREVGLSPRAASAKAALVERCDLALDSEGAGSKRWSLWVPGRVELLGKHTDYAGGRSLLCALERGLCVRGATRRDGLVRVIDIAAGQRYETSLTEHDPRHQNGWTHYVATVVRRAVRDFKSLRRGADIAFASDLPMAAGMGSSSALVTAIFLALSKANELPGHDDYRRLLRAPEDLAAYLGAVESGEPFGKLPGDFGVGTLGGAQDHTAILCSEAGHIVRYAFIPVRREGVVEFPRRHTLVIGVSGVTAEKTGAALADYNRISTAVRRLVDTWNRETRRHDLSLAEAVGSSPDAPERLRAVTRKINDPAIPPQFARDRLEQFLAEAYEIIPAAMDALQRRAVAELGMITDRSQRMAEELLGNQVPQTIALQRYARELGAVAASAFGGGFGGSVWAMVPDSLAHHFAEDWGAKYKQAYPGLAARAMFFTSPPGPPATQW